VILIGWRKLWSSSSNSRGFLGSLIDYQQGGLMKQNSDISILILVLLVIYWTTTLFFPGTLYATINTNVPKGYKTNHELTLLLKNGKKLVFKDTMVAVSRKTSKEELIIGRDIQYFPEDNYITDHEDTYTLLNHHVQEHYFEIDHSFYECGEVLFIHDETGKINLLDSTPVFSPDRKRIAVASDCEYVFPCSFYIYQLLPKKLKKELYKHVGAEKAVWIDNNTVQFTQWNYESILPTENITLEFQQNKWRVKDSK
jgi:hypothetical protein